MPRRTRDLTWHTLSDCFVELWRAPRPSSSLLLSECFGTFIETETLDYAFVLIRPLSLGIRTQTGPSATQPPVLCSCMAAPLSHGPPRNRRL